MRELSEAEAEDLGERLKDEPPSVGDSDWAAARYEKWLTRNW